MSGFIGQVRALPANALLRGRADPDYADGDDSTWTSVDWPSLTRTESVLGRSLSFVDTGGDGPVVLFLHGLGGLWQNWLLNIPHFMERDYRVVAPDLPGFGDSEMPAGRISIQGFARVIDELCSRLDVVDSVVVGNSMGGFVGAELALAFPTRVRRLVLVSAAGISAETKWREPILAIGRLMGVSARVGASSLPVVSRPRLRRAALQLVVRYPERLSVPLASELVRGTGTKGFVGGLDAVLAYSFRERLPDIQVSTLIIWGRNDTLIPVEDAYEFQRLIGDNARVEVFDDTGHLAMLERPTRFNALLDAFIAGAAEPEAGIPGVRH